jgi:hypothetical protein
MKMNVMAAVRDRLRRRQAELKLPQDRRNRRARARAQERAMLSKGQRRWRRAFRGIVTVAEGRRLSDIDARPHNQRKGAKRRRAQAAARRQMMPPKLRYVSPDVRFLREGPRG